MGIKIPKLDVTNQEILQEEARAKIPKHAPEWTDHNLSDPGITFIELFAWLSDVELYRLNRITPKHLDGFLALLGDNRPSAIPSQGLLVAKEPLDKSLYIPIGTKVELNNQNKHISFETQTALYGNPSQLIRIRLFQNHQSTTLKLDENQRPEGFYAFGLEEKKENYFTLTLDSLLSQQLQLYIELEEEDLPTYPKGWEKEKAWLQEHDPIELLWTINDVPIVPQEDNTLQLRYSGEISFFIDKLFQSDASVEIKCQLTQGKHLISPLIKNIYLNSVKVIQTAQREERFIASGEAGQKISLLESYLIDTHEKKIEVFVEDKQKHLNAWKRVKTLQNANEEAKEFTYNNRTQTLQFGDGEKGAIPLKERSILCKFTTSQGKDGEIQQTLHQWKIEKHLFFNPKPIKGGNNFPNHEERFNALSRAWRSPKKAVSLADYESLAKATWGLRVARTKAFADKRNNHITLVVLPYSRGNYALPDAFFLKRICRFLDTKRLISTSIEVKKPKYTKVSLSLQLKASPQYNTSNLRQEITTSINTYLHPLKGGDNHQGWVFGRPIYLSDIYRLMKKISGVEALLNLSFSGEGEYDAHKKQYRIRKDSLIETMNHSIHFELEQKNCGGLL